MAASDYMSPREWIAWRVRMKKTVHPKELRPDVTWPSPDPSKEPVYPKYKVGEYAYVKPNVWCHGWNIGGCSGIIKSLDAYIVLTINMQDPKTKTWSYIDFPLCQYEVEKDAGLDLVWDIKKMSFEKI